ncbi:uncharacterized protein SPPG_01642 [Spizellomyces punctatus DAOM BR117]|uniref:Histidine acid phosphatase n=1 Tax=Spizellomyces punctatus (strain DAOM BR117) TaxID=645134 RepID=A0A0L0HTL7_SPIPD|nr:uncharacterized protein SPPG_01642 [Spizellomyces punctatus DAOM BR117]KND04209.1 hypothetical protein SPPG_01642 [Spizellomyces punctatus DAOM BR117]|eukprot:XP_016612248.1 hypothetical protein SPPG_01642 [Spizellomyces punctatus DAOM BR117]
MLITRSSVIVLSVVLFFFIGSALLAHGLYVPLVVQQESDQTLWEGRESKGPEFAYCHARTPDVETYKRPKDAKLLQTIAVIRHGDRSPIAVLPYENVTWECASLDQNIPAPGFNNGRGKLQTALHMSVPGDNPFSAAIWSGSCAPGQLTPKGAKQQIKLGKAFGDIYKHLIRKGSIKVRSTDVWRTQQSAEALLAGMNSRVSISRQPVVVKTVPLRIETMVPNTEACPRVTQLWHDNQGQDVEWSSYLTRNEGLRKRLDEIMGTEELWDSANYRSFDRYFDVIAGRTCNNKPLPCSPGRAINGDCVTSEMAEQIFENGNWETKRLFAEGPFAKELVTISIGDWLREIRNLMEAHEQRNEDRVHFSLYSGHDTTVAPLLGALGARGRQMNWPPYASNILIELWKQAKVDHEALFVRVLYNGEPLDVEWCDLSWCSLSEFKKHIGQFVPVELVKECQLQ